MDTNKNIGINEFSGGMNADVSYNVIQRNLYTYGENVRISTNSLIGEAESPDKKEGSLVLIPEGVIKEISLDEQGNINYAKIASILQMDNLCIVITKNPTDGGLYYTWSIYRIDLSDDTNIQAKKIFDSLDSEKLPIDRKISTVINKEVNGIIKLYVADGERQILSINVNPEFDEYNKNLTVDLLVSNSYFPKNKITIEQVISGKLPVGQVQYTYRFYKKYGVKSKLAPLTNKILVINNNRNTEKGNAEDTDSSIGFLLKISYDEDCINLFDRILIFRIYYKKVDIDADIELIYDEKLSSDNSDGNVHFMQFNDIGRLPLQEYTAELFSLLDGQDIVPKVIEHNQGYLFAANVDDKTRLKLDGFDARAYSANVHGLIVLYDEQDTTYSGQPKNTQNGQNDQDNERFYQELYEFNQIENIKSNHTLNKFADINISDNDYASDTACRFDDCGYLGGTGPNVSWRFVTTHIPIISKEDIDKKLAPSIISEDDHQLYYLKLKDVNGSSPKEYYIEEEPIDRTSLENDPSTNNSIDGSEGETPTVNSMLRDNGINASAKITYNDILTSSCVRSLRRDEVYRYGIILYDKTGKQSDVNWIADIKTPSANEFVMYNTHHFEPSGVTLIDIVNQETSTQQISRAETGGITSYKYKLPVSLQAAVLLTKGLCIYVDDFNPEFSTFKIKALQSYNSDIDGTTHVIAGRDNSITIPIPAVTLEDLPLKILNVIGDYNSTFLSFIEGIRCYFDDWSVEVWNEEDSDWTTVSVDEYNKSYSSDEQHSVRIHATFILLFDILAPKIGLKIEVGGVTGKIIAASSNPTDYIYASPIGIEFNVKNLPENIIGYQIVRCSKDKEYKKNVMQCIVSVPIRQLITETRYSPYYPHYLLTSCSYAIFNKGKLGFGENGIYGSIIKKNTEDQLKSHYHYYNVMSDISPSLFQLYSPEITTMRNDTLSEISDCNEMEFFGASVIFRQMNWVYEKGFTKSYWENGQSVSQYGDYQYYTYKDEPGAYVPMTYNEYVSYDKSNASIVTYYCDYLPIDKRIVSVHDIKDGKSPLWENAYSDVLLGGDGEDKVGITSATKLYKSYTTSITSKEYVNWVCNAMYDIKAFKNDVNSDQRYDGWGIIKYGELYEQYHDDPDKWFKIAYNTREYGEYNSNYNLAETLIDVLKKARNDGQNLPLRTPSNSGFIGPGPLCFIASTDKVENLTISVPSDNPHIQDWRKAPAITQYSVLGAHIINIKHTAILYAGLSNSDKQFDTYYGFGDFHLVNENANAGSSFVFDGDVYIVPFEIVQMFKTYDFNSSDSLQSALFVYYVILESPVNTFFDYGMNFRNTQAKTLQLEPGEISGVASQDRPLSLYNPVLSNNSSSNDIYSARSNEDLISKFSGRMWFSNHKTSGESMDNWLLFSPLDYLDADSRFGDITCLTSVKDSIYCWQDRSFGKISVNERSLVKDNNSNMIQLGQGGVAQRIDYIDSVHGMSPDLYVCENVANLIYWIDDKNKSIMMSDGTQSVNLSERSNVQSILNREFDNSDLSIGFDLQSDELLCKCLSDGKLIIFNTKLNIATSIYTREYDQLVRIDDKLYGFINNEKGKLALKKYGGLTHLEVGNMKYMPARVEFIMNENSSITKVFDNQEIVFSNITMTQSDFKSHVKVGFDTNIANSTIPSQAIDATSYEGNIRYAIPRIGNVDYGNRIRGKWLKVSVELDGYVPNSISHVLTKFRQSY